jgi:Flp pilus assembly pilin Flp
VDADRAGLTFVALALPAKIEANAHEGDPVLHAPSSFTPAAAIEQKPETSGKTNHWACDFDSRHEAASIVGRDEQFVQFAVDREQFEQFEQLPGRNRAAGRAACPLNSAPPGLSPGGDMKRRSRALGIPRRCRGASAVEYIVVLVVVAVAGIAGYKGVGDGVKCKLAVATGLFGGQGAPSCGQSNSGPPSPPVAMNGPGDGKSDNCRNGACLDPGKCFVAGTPVFTDHGLVPIEKLEPGTRVLARDDEGDAVDWKPVVRTFSRQTQALVRLVVSAGDGSEETLDVTPGHRLYAVGRGWVEVEALAPGRDTLTGVDSASLAIRSAEMRAQSSVVYNVEVADYHTYFVGRSAVWAHNQCGGGSSNNGYEGFGGNYNDWSNSLYGNNSTNNGYEGFGSNYNDWSNSLYGNQPSNNGYGNYDPVEFTSTGNLVPGFNTSTPYVPLNPRNGLRPGQTSGGRAYGNRNGALPTHDGNGNRITYTEYDVYEYTGRNRGTYRIVVGSDGRHWFTDDHYTTFTETYDY